MFAVTGLVKDSGKEKHVYSGYGITFDSAGSWSFDNDIDRNVVIFRIDDSSSSHAENCNNNFSVLGKFLSLYYHTNNSCLLMEKKCLGIKLKILTLGVQLNFSLEVSLIGLVLLSPEKYL